MGKHTKAKTEKKFQGQDVSIKEDPTLDTFYRTSDQFPTQSRIDRANKLAEKFSYGVDGLNPEDVPTFSEKGKAESDLLKFSDETLRRQKERERAYSSPATIGNDFERDMSDVSQFARDRFANGQTAQRVNADISRAETIAAILNARNNSQVPTASQAVDRSAQSAASMAETSPEKFTQDIMNKANALQFAQQQTLDKMRNFYIDQGASVEEANKKAVTAMQDLALTKMWMTRAAQQKNKSRDLYDAAKAASNNPSGLGAILGTVIGGGLGAIGGPATAMAGASAGGGAGNFIESLL